MNTIILYMLCRNISASFSKNKLLWPRNKATVQVMSVRVKLCNCKKLVSLWKHSDFKQAVKASVTYRECALAILDLRQHPPMGRVYFQSAVPFSNMVKQGMKVRM
jgi:hypothetical protein